MRRAVRETGVGAGPTVVLAALASELEGVRELEVLGGERLVVAETGVGKSLSALRTQYYIDRYAPSRIILIGTAGALSPNLTVGDLLLAEECMQWDVDATSVGLERGRIPRTDYRILRCDHALLASARRFQPAGAACYVGRLLTGDTVVSGAGADRYRFLREELGGDALDMESASVALCAAVNGVPFLSCRTISDRVFETEPVDFRRAVRRASENARELLRHILGEPA